MQEVNANMWSKAAIMGHLKSSKLFFFRKQDGDILLKKGLITISQIFQRNDNQTIRKDMR